MIVIKLGGSLLATSLLLPCLEKIEQSYRQDNVVIVPGGGVFADQVRATQKQWGFDDRTAHQMAILGMKQTALLCKGLKPDFALFDSAAEFSNLTNCSNIAIWSPDVTELDLAGIPPSWDITSDSLSAWLAKTLGADELILVKSVKIDENFNVPKLAQLQIVDARFYEFIQQVSSKVTIIHAENFLS